MRISVLMAIRYRQARNGDGTRRYNSLYRRRCRSRAVFGPICPAQFTMREGVQQPTKEKLHALRLHGMIEAIDRQEQDEEAPGASSIVWRC